jgi:Tol biopolymer transport system component
MTVFMVVGVLVTVAETPASATVPGANGKIAYTRGNAIWTMNADGSGQTPLSSPFVTFHHEPPWSPDGTKILFRTDPQASGRDDIVVIDADGVFLANLTNTPGIDEFEPSWSPDTSSPRTSRSTSGSSR